VQSFAPREATDDLNHFLESLTPLLHELLAGLLREHHGIKVWLSVQLTYRKILEEGRAEAHLTTKSVVLHNDFELDEVLDNLVQEVQLRNAHYLRNASPFAIDSVDNAVVHTSKYAPLGVGRYKELPAFLAKKKCLVNVINNDDRCFGYSLLAHLMPLNGVRNRAQRYNPYFERFNLADLQYPVEPRDVPSIEDRLELCINIFSFFDDEGKGRFPLYVSKKQYQSSVDLLYWDGHYALITSFDRLMCDVTRMKVRKFICRRCFGHFSSEQAYETHQFFCSQPNFQHSIFTLPAPNTVLKYSNIRYQQRVPFVIYADTECICLPDGHRVKRTKFQTHHAPCAIGFKLVSDVPALSHEPYQSHTGPDVVDWFMNQLLQLMKRCLEYLFDDQRLIMTPADWVDFRAAQKCYICGYALGKDNKVRDHDHLTGKYRGAAHNHCNLMLRKTYKIPVFFHNFRGYDSHLVVWGLRSYPGMEISLIGQGMEKYLSLSWGDHLIFKDSYQFLASSLETLCANLLRTGKDRFIHLQSQFQEAGAPHPAVDLLLRKGVFPYDYLNDWAKMDEQALPNRDAFRNTLRQEECSEADYAHAQRVWQEFGCTTLRQYLELYLKTDVLILADVFEEFRRVCAHNYQLDAAHYVSAPQLSWDSMLKSTQCTLELISDPEMFRFIDPGIRGGVSNITTRYAKANNPYLAQFDPSKPTSYIIDLDANNLYGWAMSNPMPSGSFTWLLPAQFQQLDWRAMTEDQPMGYIIECDLDYPADVHEAQNDYPLAPERLNVQVQMVSGTQVELLAHYHIPRSSWNPKLVPNLMAKSHYVVHYLNLRFYMEHGLRLVQVHRVLRFTQSRWLKPYIDLNTSLRAAAKNEFEKEFFKLMNNSIYGKTCENQKKRTDIKLITSEEKRKKLTEKPHCMGFRIFDESLVGVEMRKVKTLINKPFYVGFCVLELSKLHMYR
jgi:hypothetical protein